LALRAAAVAEHTDQAMAESMAEPMAEQIVEPMAELMAEHTVAIWGPGAAGVRRVTPRTLRIPARRPSAR